MVEGKDGHARRREGEQSGGGEGREEADKKREAVGVAVKEEGDERARGTNEATARPSQALQTCMNVPLTEMRS